jgi:membrane protein DedA with SNARE-associated domain
MHLTSLLDAITEWAQGVIQALGYPGLGFVMFLENVFPPIPSELVLPLAGWLTLDKSTGFTLLGVTLVGAIGSVAGAFCLYGLGTWLDESRVRLLLKRYGKWFLLSEKDLDVALTWFNRYGEYVIFFGRMVPLVRSLISVPAGFARMPLGRFAFYTALGTALWSFLLAFAGRMLGSRWQFVAEIIDRYETVVILLIVVAALVFIYMRWQQNKSQKQGPHRAA